MSNQSDSSPLGRKSNIFILVGLLITSTVINAFQARKVFHLESTLTALKSEGQLAVGSSVPAIEAVDANGNPVTLSYASNGPPAVLYVFSPQCKWCERNLDSVKTLAKDIGPNYRFSTIALSEKDLPDYITSKDFHFPVLTRLSLDTLKAYKLGGTPQTLVISSEGRVQKTWMGAYMGDTKKDIEAFFNVRLPDLPQK